MQLKVQGATHRESYGGLFEVFMLHLFVQSISVAHVSPVTASGETLLWNLTCLQCTVDGMCISYLNREGLWYASYWAVPWVSC